jgi:hypothetical protein
MSPIGQFARVAILGIAVAASPMAAAVAQEISEQHLAAALEATKHTPQIGNFDLILPRLATQVEDRFIRLRPDLHEEVVQAVEEAALRLAIRRNDLQNDIARLWAKRFSEEELAAVAAFFSSEIGQKYKAEGGALVGEISKVLDSWTERVGDELIEKSREELKKLGFEL